ncbi:MAG: NlpC/P60 family protein [Solirubrobacteraceae bacterium]|nr:NlpC/P60 family protein [Solirubrobacteraceae bacterium]
MGAPRRSLITFGLIVGLSAIGVPTASVTAAAASAATAPGDVSRELRRQQLFLTVAQTKSVQRRIDVRADGDWGSKTVDAMRRYQRRHRLAVTGSANVESLRRMRLAVADRFEAQLWAARSAARRGPTPTSASKLASTALRTARTALGTPYRDGGRTTSGFDCSGLVHWAFAHAGRTLPRTSQAMYKRGWAVTKATVRPGDLVFFDSAGRGASHVGIVVSRTTAISATTSSGVAIHDIATGYWADHYVGARRLAAD